MDSPPSLPPALPLSAMATIARIMTSGGQQRIIELEEEVARLQKMLNDEEKVHEILERALLPNGISIVRHVPSFLPKKAKELLAELIMVEEEIARLEGDISKIQQSINNTQESQVQDSKKFELYRHKSTSLIASSSQQSISPTRMPSSKVFEEKIAFETKPMFFINQAIKGDYSNHGFASNGNSLETVNKKQRQRKTINHERISWKSGIIEQQHSPKKSPRHPSPRQSDSHMEILHKLLSEPASSTSPLEKNDQKWQPNKLSEKILKCLICIFLRLMRTSRAMELEKSSNISRSSSSFLKTRSLDSSLNLNASLNTNRETGQMDPYGIFDIEDSLVRDIGPYKNLVRFTSSSLEPKGIAICLPLLNNLRILIRNLRVVDLKLLTHQQKLAFWINIHNICVMNWFLEHGFCSNPEKIHTLRNKAVLNVGGNKINALAIEHFILRKLSNTKEAYLKGDKDGEEDALKSIYGLEHAEPNVTFALCCGSRSSPAVKIYTCDGISVKLEKAKLEYLQASIVVTASRSMMIPKLLVSNMSDFAADLDTLVDWICNQLPTSGPLRKSIVESVRGQGTGNISDIVDILPYDFEFQYLLPM